MKQQAGNALIHETSPYLLQHAHNPVNWYPWSEATLEKAKNENSLLLISIGYSACHWCHVMEKESFEDASVAEIMNKNYISVKVDREERPDVDQVYMQACYAVTGNGGWPLNVIALPDGRPVYAGTYFPKSKWIQLLDYFAELFRSQSGILERQASELKSEMQSYLDSPFGEEELMMDKEDMGMILKGILGRLDEERGGLMGAPKFPMPAVFEFLLDHHALHKDTQSLERVITSLDHMAAGGIYDQLGGGFFRYSTDSNWLVPHFEKMLYDNAQLIRLYANAFRVSRKPLYESIVRQTIAFVQKSLYNGKGGFYSSLDADSEGEEGKYYTWRMDELKNIPGIDIESLALYYNLSGEGNWEKGKNILHYIPGNMEDPGVFAGKEILLKERHKRVPPALDNKILTAWNALMIGALADAHKALGDEEYLTLALESARFITSNMITKEHVVYRNYNPDGPGIRGFLDDYAFLINALLSLYQLSLDEYWAILSMNLCKKAIEDFYAPQEKRFYYNSAEDHHLIIRPSESDDNVIPSSTAVMMDNLRILSAYFDDPDLARIRSEVLKSMPASVKRKPVFHSFWAKQYLYELSPEIEIIVVGEGANEIILALQQHYLPGILLSGSKKKGTFSRFGYKYIEGKTLIYVCVDKACKMPVETLEEARVILKELGYASNM